MKPIDLFRAGFWGSGDAASIIAGLFSEGQQGFWLPFTDFASLSQDSAGTLPYTALQQPVGLILDKSKGGGRGTELSPNGGTFDDAAGWTITQPTSSISGGVLNVGAGACDIFPSTASVVAGKSYEVTFTISNSTANYGIRILNRDIISAGNYFPAGAPYITANGSYRFVCVAISNGSIGVNRVSGHTGSLQVDNFSVKEIPGNHASQVTSTARGVVSARVNLLVNSEFTGFVAGSPGTFPTGWASGLNTGTISNDSGSIRITNAAGQRTFVYQLPAIHANVAYRARLKCFIHSGILYAGNILGTNAVAPATVGYYLNGVLTDNFTQLPVGVLFTLEWRFMYAAAGPYRVGAGVGIGGNVVGDATLFSIDCVTESQASLPYQRVNTSTDYDAIGFPKSLRVEVDDFYTCGGGGSTTGFYYSDVVSPTSSATTVLFSDIGTNSGYEFAIMNTGVLKLFWGNGTSFSSVSIGGVLISALNHVAVWDDASNIYLQINGGTPVTVARGVFVAGTANCKLYRTNGASAFFFNGQVTEPIYRAGPPPNAYERDVIRTYQMQKAGML